MARHGKIKRTVGTMLVATGALAFTLAAIFAGQAAASDLHGGANIYIGQGHGGARNSGHNSGRNSGHDFGRNSGHNFGYNVGHVGAYGHGFGHHAISSYGFGGANHGFGGTRGPRFVVINGASPGNSGAAAAVDAVGDYQTPRYCRHVYKYVYDDYGRRVKIGGEMCFDHHGYSYIVPGSRQVIGRY